MIKNAAYFTKMEIKTHVQLDHEYVIPYIPKYVHGKTIYTKILGMV